VRAPLFTTAIQVASRLILVWVVGYQFPQTTKWSPAYSSMLLAWSVTEVIRYGYFVFALSGEVPKLWTWLRYVFSPLYPYLYRHTRNLELEGA
jgi:very-long-chain (3R)-3-hydroxyacyl-CoA dehydratase